MSNMNDHYSSFVAMLCLLHSVSNGVQKLSAMNPGHFGNVVEEYAVRNHIVLLQIDTLCCK